MEDDDILLVWQTASGAVKTIRFADFADDIIVSGGGGGTPGGSPQQLQYNNAGVFGGIPTATYDGVTLTLIGATILSPVGIVKADVGLGSVDNTSDLDKPISTAAQTALNAKAPVNSPTLTGVPVAPTAAPGTNTTQISTTQFVESEIIVAISALSAVYVAKGPITTSGLTMATARILGRTTAATGSIEEITIGSGLSLSAGALTATGSGGTVTTVSVTPANGFSGSVANATTTPAITISTTITGLLLGNGTAVSASKVALTQPATSAIITVLDGKTFTVNKTLTMDGTDGTTMTFPTTSATLARTDAANTFTGVQTMTSPALTTPAITGIATWQAGVRQTFNPNATTPGFNPGSVSGDPSTPANGDIWYDSTGNLLRARINGATVSLGSGGGGSGTVNSGTATQIAYYPASTTAVSSTATMTVSSTGRLAFQPTIATSGSTPYLTITAPTDTTLAAGTEAIGISFIPANPRQFASNTGVATQREYNFGAPVYSFASATGTITTASTVNIQGAPAAGTNAIITFKWALNIAADSINIVSGGLVFGSSITGSSITQSSNLLTVNSTGGMNLRPSISSGGILSIAGTAQDVVISDNSSFPAWQGVSSAGSGFQVQRAGTAVAIRVLSVGTGQNTAIEQTMANGSYGSLTATENARQSRWGMRTYGGTTWVTNTIIDFVCTQTQSESARGSKIVFATTPTGATAVVVAATLDQDGSFKLATALGGLGYATGAGGAVTQLTSRTTGVTLNKVCGDITLFSAAGLATYQSFTLTNSAIAVTDTVDVTQKSGTDLYEIHVTNTAAGSCQITFRTTGGVTVEQPVFHFSVLKSVNA